MDVLFSLASAEGFGRAAGGNDFNSVLRLDLGEADETGLNVWPFPHSSFCLHPFCSCLERAGV
jgi:hypothetical protein